MLNISGLVVAAFLPLKPEPGSAMESHLSTEADLVAAIYLVFIWILSVYANGVVLTALLRQKTPLLPVDILMCFLAVSNGLLALITYPMVEISLVSHQWKFGEAGCAAYAFITMFLGLSSIFNLPAIAYVLLKTITAEYVSVRKASDTRTNQCGTIGPIIAAICTVSFVLCILPVIGVGEYGIAKHGSSCTINWSAKSCISVAYVTLLMITGFVFPITCTALLYCQIVTYLHQLKERYINMDLARKWNKVENDTLMMTVAVGSCMVVCWTPYAVVAVWETFFDPTTLPVELEATAAFAAKSSTAFTPLVHLCFTKKCRQWLCRAFTCFELENATLSGRNLVTRAETKEPSVSRFSPRPSFLQISTNCHSMKALVETRSC